MSDKLKPKASTELTNALNTLMNMPATPRDRAQPTPTSNARGVHNLKDVTEAMENLVGGRSLKACGPIIEAYASTRTATVEADLSKAREVIAELVAALEWSKAYVEDLGNPAKVYAALQSARAFMTNNKENEDGQ